MVNSAAKVKNQKTWRDAISATEKILTLAEIWPKENMGFFSKLKMTFFIIATILFDICNLLELKNLMIKQDYELLSTHLSTFGLYTGYPVKIIIFFFKKQAFKRMLDFIDSPIFEDYPPSMQKHKDNCISVSNGIAIFYISCVAASIFLYLNKPLYTKYTLPISFSYDLNGITYGLVLALQCFGCYYLVMVGICFDMITIGLMNIAKAQLDILNDSIGLFRPKNPNFLQQEEHVFLRKCAVRHQTVIRYVNETENVFTFIFLTQCLESVTSICNGAFQLTHTEEVLSINFLFNFAFAFDVLFEIGICCWFGGLLTIKSLEVSDACFNYDWINSSTTTRKSLLLMITRSQKPLFLTVGKFAQLSMRSFLMVLKTAYSYFALMQTLYDKKNNQFM